MLKKYHVSKNLWNNNFTVGYHLSQFSGLPTEFTTDNSRMATLTPIDVATAESVTFNFTILKPGSFRVMYSTFTTNDTLIERVANKEAPFTIDTSNASKLYIAIYRGSGSDDISESMITNIMLNTGSQPLPYEPYSSEVWHDIPYYLHNTSIDIITTLPADIYANAATATVGLKGQTAQSGTPSPQNPVMPNGCGDLETSGAKAGQYKIPISSANTTTPVYLGEVQTTRKIKKYEFTGQEGWMVETGKTYVLEGVEQTQTGYTDAICSHYALATSYTTVTTTNNTFSISRRPALFIHDDNYTSTTDFKAYLAQQYAAGTPVTVWYVLAEPTTGIVNEPLMKIGNYADTLSNVSIPVTAGGDTISVGTTVQPSEVTVNYKGWHPKTPKESNNGQWS